MRPLRRLLPAAVFLLVLALLAVPRTAAAQSAPYAPSDLSITTYRALLIGICDYDTGDPATSWPDLVSPCNDVWALEELLRSRFGFTDVTVVASKDRSGKRIGPIPRARITAELAALQERSGTKDAVLVYVGGHGHAEGPPEARVGYLVPSDAPLPKGNALDSGMLVPHGELYDKLVLNRAERLAFVLDTCHSGLFLAKRKGMVAARPADDLAIVKEQAGHRSRQVMTSGADELVADNAYGSRYSAFASALMLSLRADPDPLVSFYAACGEARLPARGSGSTVPQCDYFTAPEAGHQPDFAFVNLDYRAPLPPAPPPSPPGTARGPESLVNEHGLRMVAVDLAPFRMGSPTGEPDRDNDEAEHQVTLSGNLRVMNFPATRSLYRAVMGVDLSWERQQHWAGEDRGDCRTYARPYDEGGQDEPVTCLTWMEAVRFANELSRLEGLVPAYVYQGDDPSTVRRVPGASGYRLLTEAEYEYLARARGSGRFGAVDDASSAQVCANNNVATSATTAKFTWITWDVFGCDDGDEGVAPLSRMSAYRANAFGLHQMLGNVRTWVEDWYEYTLADATDPRGPATPKRTTVTYTGGSKYEGPAKVVRGGAWRGGPRGARVADRSALEPSGRSAVVGVRLARSIP